MIPLRRSRILSAWLAAWLLLGGLPLPAHAEDAPPAAPAEVEATLGQARQRLKAGDYDGAIDILSKMLQSERERAAALGEIYPLYVDAYVQLGNAYKYKEQGRATSDLHFKNARDLVAECLGNKALRHIRPEPASEFSEETSRFFEEYRGKNFGSFRVVELDPPDAVVLLDADTLRVLSGDTMLGDVDISKGQHLVVVRAPGHKDVTEEITISANSTLERPYRLSHKRGRRWYATVATGTIGAVGGLIALTRGGKSGTAAPEPLAGPPDPPSH